MALSNVLFVRNLRRCGKEITLQDRNIVAPNFGGVDFDENFSDKIDRMAMVKTINGKTFFDGVSTERLITHEFMLIYEPGIVDDDTVTAETWILFRARRIDILQVINCCEDDQMLKLICSERGVGEAAKA